jgi:hypothetical protein
VSISWIILDAVDIKSACIDIAIFELLFN